MQQHVQQGQGPIQSKLLSVNTYVHTAHTLHSQHSLGSSLHGAHVLETLIWDSAPRWHKYVTSVRQICELHTRAAVCPLHYHPKVVEQGTNHMVHCHCCSGHKKVVNCGHKGRHVQVSNNVQLNCGIIQTMIGVPNTITPPPARSKNNKTIPPVDHWSISDSDGVVWLLLCLLKLGNCQLQLVATGKIII